jgi:hypothetical protein
MSKKRFNELLKRILAWATARQRGMTQIPFMKMVLVFYSLQAQVVIGDLFFRSGQNSFCL